MEKSEKQFAVIKYKKKALNVFFLSVILINSNYRKDTDYYSQVS